MPELPDLTVFAENLTKLIAGKKIAAVTCHAERNCTVSPDQLAQALVSAEIAGVERSGKELCFLIGKHRLLVHLMLTGGFVMNTPARFPIFTIAFADGSRLALNDPKGWAKIALNPQESPAGVDALEVTADHLKRLFAQKPRSLAKAVLIDQQLIKGIGNAYADEILWEARISPKSAVGKIPPEAVGAARSGDPCGPAAGCRADQSRQSRHHSRRSEGFSRGAQSVPNGVADGAPDYGGNGIFKENLFHG